MRILLIKCTDETGLVYKITRALFDFGCSIHSNGEFVDRANSLFFMRTEFEGEFDEERLLANLKGTLPQDAEIHIVPEGKKPIVIMVTKEHHCIGELLLRHEFGKLNAEIKAVIGNHDILKSLVEKFEIPFHHVTHEGVSREDHEDQVFEIINQYDPTYLVLAKYMRILNPSFVERMPNHIINIHHSFLPAFIGANPYKQAFERGVKIIGATAHFVTDDLDKGPIISQSVMPVDHTHGAREMAQAGRDVEKQVLSNALELVFQDRVFVSGNKTVIFD